VCVCARARTRLGLWASTAYV